MISSSCLDFRVNLNNNTISNFGSYIRNRLGLGEVYEKT